MAHWVLELKPQHFGFLRSRWYCGVIVLLLVEIHELCVSPETVRRWRHREQVVWRRPRPVVGSSDPEQAAKRQALRQLLAALPANEIAVFQDEVDINSNPKKSARCGCCAASKRSCPRPAPMRSTIWPARSTGAQAA
jgi:putative transposase